MIPRMRRAPPVPRAGTYLPCAGTPRLPSWQDDGEEDEDGMDDEDGLQDTEEDFEGDATEPEY